MTINLVPKKLNLHLRYTCIIAEADDKRMTEKPVIRV
jgi:hypothetical protein